MSIARAIVHDPPVLIFDEATTGLDVLVARALLDTVAELRDQGKCIVFSTHIMREAERLCDRIAIMHRGHILAEGTLDELRDQHEERDLEELFFQLISRHNQSLSPSPRILTPRPLPHMNWRNIRLIYAREIRDQLRDRRTLFMIAVLPLLLYPLLGMSVFQLSQFVRKSEPRVLVVGCRATQAGDDLPTLFDDGHFATKLTGDPKVADWLHVEFAHARPDSTGTASQGRRRRQIRRCGSRRTHRSRIEARRRPPEVRRRSSRPEFPARFRRTPPRACKRRSNPAPKAQRHHRRRRVRRSRRKTRADIQLRQREIARRPHAGRANPRRLEVGNRSREPGRQPRAGKRRTPFELQPHDVAERRAASAHVVEDPAVRASSSGR